MINHIRPDIVQGNQYHFGQKGNCEANWRDCADVFASGGYFAEKQDNLRQAQLNVSYVLASRI